MRKYESFRFKGNLYTRRIIVQYPEAVCLLSKGASLAPSFRPHTVVTSDGCVAAQCEETLASDSWIQ